MKFLKWIRTRGAYGVIAAEDTGQGSCYTVFRATMWFGEAFMTSAYPVGNVYELDKNGDPEPKMKLFKVLGGNESSIGSYRKELENKKE